MGAPKEMGIKDKILIRIEHIKQKYTWDCGISCIMMILDEQSRNHFIDKFASICAEEGFEERKQNTENHDENITTPTNCNTWSIDLAYLLKRFGIRHQYCTITLGVHPEFSSETFYRNVLSKDRQRVITRFQLSAGKGVFVEEGSVTIYDILSHLSLGGPIIVLVNANLLNCDSCHQNGFALKACIPCSPSPPFQGHYIVLVGFNYNLSKIFYRNPGRKEGLCSMSFSAFDKARKSFGTDEDIIFIHNFGIED